MMWECNLCKKKFTTNRGLTSHKINSKNCNLFIDLKCSKCEKIFNTKSNLEQHLKRKISCENSHNLKCNRCEKKFTNNYLLQKHINQKIPCAESKTFLSLEEEKELIELKHKYKMEEIEAQKEKEIMVELKHKYKLEEIEAQKEKELVVEKAKTNRKEKTTQIINNFQQNILIQKQENFIVNLPTQDVLDATKENLELPIQDFKKSIRPIEAIKMVYGKKNNSGLPIELISKLHGKEAPPEYRNIWYNSDLDCFYKIKNGAWKNVQEDEEIVKQIRTSLHNALQTIQNFAEHYNNYSDNHFHGNFIRFQGFINSQDNAEYYRNIATQSLDYQEI